MHLLFSQAAITHPTTWLARNPTESIGTALPAPLAVQLRAKPGNSYCTEVPSRSELTSFLKLLVRNSSPRSSHALSLPLAFRRNQAVQLGLGDTLNEGRWSLQQMYSGAEGITANWCCHYCTGLWKGKPLSKIERSTPGMKKSASAFQSFAAFWCVRSHSHHLSAKCFFGCKIADPGKGFSGSSQKDSKTAKKTQNHAIFLCTFLSNAINIIIWAS